jgi:hypothetical protein
VEWQIGDGVDEELVVKTPARARQWRNDLIALMIMLGGSLGLMYRSIQEPPARPIPTPWAVVHSPPLITDATLIYSHTLSLQKTIGLEANALADGDLSAFLLIQDRQAIDRLQAVQPSFEPWGHPSQTDAQFGQLYFSIQTFSPVPPRDRATADIRQYRNGVYFRETRFYRLENDAWLHTRPDLSFWSGQTAFTRTPHFDLTFPIEDEALIDQVAGRFEAAYLKLCSALNCPLDFRGAALHLVVSPQTDRVTSYGGLPVTFILPSPRVIGLIDQRIDLDPAKIDPLDAYTLAAYDGLVIPAAMIAAGGVNRWTKTNDGQLFAEAIAVWESVRLKINTRFAIPYHKPATTEEYQQLRPLPSLESLWSITPNASFFSDDQRLKRRLAARSVIAFIDAQYGAAAVVNFLNQFASENTLPQIVQDTFGVSYSDFEQHWLKWLEPSQ